MQTLRGRFPLGEQLPPPAIQRQYLVECAFHGRLQRLSAEQPANGFELLVVDVNQALRYSRYS